MSFSAQELFGDFSDNEGFSEDENFSKEGKQLFKKLSTQSSNVNKNNHNFNNNKSKGAKDTWKSKNSNVNSNGSDKNDKVVRELYSGINLVNPLISSEELRILMQGRKMVKLSLIKSHINKKSNDIDDDWVTIGILVSKGTKTSKNGNEYSLWKLSDLKSDKVVNLFLFGASNEKHWKMSVGAVIGLLNASIMSDNKDFKGKAAELCSLTLDDPDKLLHVGTSKDMGYCQALKKNGEVCGNLIKTDDEFCLYHIKNAYRKFQSKRPEIQATFSNKEPEDYHFSNNFTPNVTLNQKNIVLELKSVSKNQMVNKRESEGKSLQKVIANPLSLAAQNLASLSSCTKKDLSNNKQSPASSQTSFKDFFSKIKDRNSDAPSSVQKDKKELPALAKGYKRGQSIDLKFTTSDTQMSAAKKRAIEILKNKPIASPKVVLPGSTNSNVASSASSNPVKSKKLQNILKRVNQNFTESSEELMKEQLELQKEKSKLIDEALKRKSVNQKVVNVIESEQEEKYFNVLEKKEKYANRLADVKQLPVKVVTCAICKYTAPSQSDLCKSKNHPVNFHKSTKRFFMCKSCKTRTFTFDSIMPSKACKNCGGTNYEKAAMIHTKTETKLGKNLLIRGEEINFLNSVK